MRKKRYEELPHYQRQNLWRYLKSPEGESGEVAWDLMLLAWSSVAALAVAPLQDLLFFCSSTRRHTRSTRDWSSDVCSSDLAQILQLGHGGPALLDVLVRDGPMDLV